MVVRGLADVPKARLYLMWSHITLAAFKYLASRGSEQLPVLSRILPLQSFHNFKLSKVGFNHTQIQP